jgi:prepilin-type N-terminal cleavage/methylation domain-containing protein
MRQHRVTKAFSLVEIMIVVLIIGLILAVAVPNFMKARQNGRRNTIITNLTKVEDAKEQCAMEEGLTAGEVCGDMSIFFTSWPPRFPIAGTLAINPLRDPAQFNGKTANQWRTDYSEL